MKKSKLIIPYIVIGILCILLFFVWNKSDSNNRDTVSTKNNSINENNNETNLNQNSEKEISSPERNTVTDGNVKVEYGKEYLSKDEVALYLYSFGELPPNYLTKNEAQKLGWVAKEGNLWEVADRFSIGGDRFTNREGRLPEGEKYFEADVNYNGGRRGAERLVYTKEGKVIYYTGDHYETFEVLYE